MPLHVPVRRHDLAALEDQRLDLRPSPEEGFYLGWTLPVPADPTRGKADAFGGVIVLPEFFGT
jgi:hypothetical protein